MLLFAASALAGTYADDFSTDRGAWSGGSVADGVLVVTDGAAELPLGSLRSLEGEVRVRLRAGARVSISLGGATWSAAYDRDGGVSLGGEAWPMPTGHYAWEPDADPVIEPGPQFWDEGDALHAEVLYDDATATWFLFWTGAHPREYYGYRQIGVATSPDGVTWTRYEGNPVLAIDYDPTTVDGIHVHMPTVVKDGADWHMFHACYQNDVGNRICHATSDDGFDWTPQGVALDLGADGAFDSGSLRMPDVLVGPDGTWHMLYNGTLPDQHYGPTGWATSPDGWTWTKLGPITDDEFRLQGGGMFEGPWGVEQWWNCEDRFCHSTADWSDLGTWSDDPAVSLEKGWSWWNDGYIQAPTPWLVGTTWHLWFNGYTYTDTFERIGHARSVPVAGAWFDLSLAWADGALVVTHDGATRTVAAAGVDRLRVEAEGVAEVDAVALTWEETGGDTGEPDTGEPDTGDTGEPDTGDTGEPDTGDTGEPDTADSGEPDTGEGEGKAEACGCAAGGGGGPALVGTLLAGLIAARRRRVGATRLPTLAEHAPRP